MQDYKLTRDADHAVVVVEVGSPSYFLEIESISQVVKELLWTHVLRSGYVLIQRKHTIYIIQRMPVKK